MAWSWADGWDCYATSSDGANGYWDTNTTNWSLVTGRFSGSRGFQATGLNAIALSKNSGVNDAVHHVVVAYQQTAAITGSLNYQFITLGDGANAQCTILFRSDGAILLMSGVFNSGTILATYTGAVPLANTWYAFEFEVLISGTVGYMNVRKNGNPANDFTSATNLNTRAGSANSYANRLSIGAGSTNACMFDDLFWRSDASSVAFLGDIRCYTRMPASDAAVQWSRSTGATNFSCVDEPQQNTTTDYVFSSTVGQEDYYGIASIASTPVSTFMVTTRAYMQKSDAGTRTAAAQLKSGASVVASPTVVLTTSGWQWAWRSDTTDPATGAAFTAAAVNNIQVGPKCVA